MQLQWFPSKTSTAWRLASNSKNTPLTMKCQINTEKSQVFRNTTQNWITSGKLAAPYNLAASLFATVLDPASWYCDSCAAMRSCLCCRRVGSFAPNDKHSLEEQLRHSVFCNFNRGTLASGKTRVAPKTSKFTTVCWLARTRKICHWPWNVRTTMKKAELPIHNTKLDCIPKIGELRSFAFLAVHNLYVRAVLEDRTGKPAVLKLWSLLNWLLL